jgi:hypothetical protein
VGISKLAQPESVSSSSSSIRTRPTNPTSGGMSDDRNPVRG